LKKRSQTRCSDGELKRLAGRLLRSNTSIGDVPVIISELFEPDTGVRDVLSSIGRLLSREGGTINVLVDRPVKLGHAVTVLLCSSAFIAEAITCLEMRRKYVVELVLIQYKD